MKWSLWFFVLILMVVVVSGCTGGGTEESEIISKDMLVIDSVGAFPSETLRPDSPFTLKLTVTNEGQTDAWMLLDQDRGTTGDMLLVDDCGGLYHCDSFDVVSSNSVCTEDADHRVFDNSGNPMSGCYLKFESGQTHTMQWDCTTPMVADIAYLAHTCNMNLQVTYAADAVSVAYIYFASPNEVEQRLYTENELSLLGTNVASYGPVVANLRVPNNQPLKASGANHAEDTYDDQDFRIYLNFKNMGSGLANVNDVTLSSSFHLEPFDGGSCDMLYDDGNLYLRKDYVSAVSDDGEVDYNYKTYFELYDTDTADMVCDIRAPSYLLVASLKPYKFTASANYVYYQKYEMSVTTDPNL